MNNNNDLMKFNKYVDCNKYKDDLMDIIAAIKPNWSFKNLVFTECTGGITNKLIIVSVDMNRSNFKDDHVVFRIYGQGTDVYINRNNEISCMKLLNALKIGAEVYGRFENGIFYEYLKGNTVNYEIIQNELIFAMIAESLANFHLIMTGSTESNEFFSKQPILFDCINKLCNIIPDSYENIKESDRYLVEKLPTKQLILKEIFKMKNNLESYFNKSKLNNVVFSHNDLLLENIIYNKDNNLGKQIMFIDFEYSGYNYQAYDIASHFNNYCTKGDTYDDSLYPCKEYQLKWIHYYLKCFLKNQSFNNQNSITDLVDDLYIQVKILTLLSHLFWGIWCIGKACNSDNTQFSFTKVAHLRFNEYFRRRDEFMSP
jgi:ethanolamine kinase